MILNDLYAVVIIISFCIFIGLLNLLLYLLDKKGKKNNDK